MYWLARIFLLLLVVAPYGVFSQAQFNVQLQNYSLHPDTYSFRLSTSGGSTGYYDMTSWESSPYTQGHMNYFQNFRMNYRLLYPGGYNVNYAPGYPLILMVHGAGERGNCWSTSCWFDTNKWNPITNDPQAGPTTNPRLLNNDHNLIHGGRPHLDAVNLAGSKLPNDPTLDSRAFPGFVLFPQCLNNWNGGQIEDVLRLVYLLMNDPAINIDPNRIYVHGLSLGAENIITALKRDPSLFACAALMSPSNSDTKVRNDTTISNVPLWVFQGGRDSNPSPNKTQNLKRWFEELGGSVRYTLYPNLGHGTWNTAYAEPDFFTWFLEKRRNNLFVYYGDSTLCSTNNKGVKLGMPHDTRYRKGDGTLANNVNDIDAYQWEKDGVILSGETKSIYFATEPGTYRGRFSRVPNPSESDWNEWSAPVKITESNPVTPVITSVGSRHIPDINGKDSVELKTDFGSKLYYNWFNNSTKLNISDSVFSIVVNSSGNYSVQNTTFGGCSSLESQPVTVTVNAPQTINAPDILSLKDLGDGKVQIYWRDNSLNETGFEIYRSTNPVGPYDFVALTNEDQVSIQDSGLTSTTTYYYTMRAVGNSAVSPYSGNVSFSTGNDTVAPTAPTLSMVNYDLTQVDLRWEGATDNTGIKEYHLQYGSTVIKIGSEFNSYTVTGILANFTYNFTIKAVDFADNESVASNQVVISTVTTGLRYEHSTGAWDDLDEIDFSNPEFTGYVDNITLDPRTQEDYFNMKFDGYLYINTADNYRFYLASDDGSRLKIDGNTIVDNDGLHGVVEKDATTYLSSGPHAVQVLFFEKTGGQALTLMYRGADIGNKKTIPNSAWRSGDPIILSPPTSPTSLQASAINSTEIDLTWNHNGKLPDDFSVVILGSSTAEGVGASTYSASWAGQFESWLGSRSTNSSVTNLAMGGFTTEDVRPDGSSPAPDITRNITKAVSLRPDLIIINLPSNNVQENIDAQTTMNHYREIKAKTDAAGIYLLVTSTQPRNTDAAKRLLLQVERDSLLNYFSDNVIDIYEELTNFTNLSIKTMYSAGDGIHLNDAGHAYIFSEVQNKVNQKFVNYEVHRSIDNSNYQLIGNSGVPTFSDLNLIPSTKYFYKVRAVNNNGTSGFSNSASATTLEDNISPTVPQGLEVITTTYTNVGLSWLASTDDSKVSKYYIYIDGVLTDSSTTISYYTSNLEPSSSYEAAVSAVDFSGNESGLSSVVTINTTSPSVFYSKASGLINTVSSWGTNADGSGVSPTDFTYNGQYFVLKNRGNFDLSSNWNVSGLITKVIVDQNVTFDVNQPIDVLMDVRDGAILNLNSDFNIKLDSVFSGSTINFSAMTQIPARSYGNLIVSGTGLKILNGNKAIVTGDISILDGAGIKGKSANSSTIELYGSMTNQGSTLFPSDDNLVGLSIKGLNSTINYSGLLNLYKLDILPNAQVQFNSGNPVPKINIGTLNGGGIIGGNGSKILMGNGILEVKDFGEFNSGNSNLILNVNGGSIIYNSNSSASSYLRFDTAGKILKNLDLNTLSGNVFIESPLEVTNAIKIKNGKLHAQGNLTLVSNSTHTTSVKSLEGNGQILGTVNAQRYLSNKGAIWRYLSTPVSGISVADWQTSIPITGNFSGSSPQSIYPSLYYYDEPNGGWIFYPDDGGSNSALLEPGRGYSLWMWNGTTPQTIQNRGTLNQGNINFTVTSGTGSPDDGWNLMGNPYASDIIWGNTGWTSNNVSNFVWVRNNHADGSYSFEIWDKSNNTGTLTNGVIAAGQSFWVQAIGASPNLAISEVSKVDTDESKELYRTETLAGELIEITLIEGLNTDKTFVKLASNSNDAYFGMSDALKKKNSTLNLSTLSTDQVSLTINELDDDFCQKQVPLLIEDVSLGSHNLLFEGISNFSNGRVSLVDHFLNTSELILSDGYSYIFNVTESEESFKNRFELLIERYEVDLSSRVISGSNIFCKSENMLSITVMESQAHVLYSVREKNSRKVLSGNFEGNGADLTLLINVDELSSQTEELEILAGFPGCEVKVLSATSTVTIQPEPVVSVFEHIIQTCSNTRVTLNASGGDYYKWENTLTGEFFEETGELLQIVPTEIYQVVKVTAFTNSGCSSNNYELIELYSSPVEKPAIVVEDNKLIVFSEMSLQWYLNGEVIEGENSTYLYPKNSGKYTVSASNSYCTMFSDELEYLVTGMPDHKKDKLDVKIYPNPSDGGIITLSGSTLNDSNVEIKIYDTFGRLLFNKAIQSEEYEKGYFINEQLSKGVYLIKVIQNNSLTETKWVVY